MLRRIQTLLQRHSPMTLAVLAQKLGSDPDTVRPMVELLARKGRVRIEKRSGCGGCFSCRPEELETYTYIALEDNAHAVSVNDPAFE